MSSLLDSCPDAIVAIAVKQQLTLKVGQHLLLETVCQQLHHYVQVRSAYRKKGWAFTDPQGIEQCAQEGFSKALQEQAGEGCHMWGAISINKVRCSPCLQPQNCNQQHSKVLAICLVLCTVNTQLHFALPVKLSHILFCQKTVPACSKDS